MTTVCDFLGIDLSDEIRKFYDHSSVHRNPAYYSGLERIHSKSIGKWKNSENRERVEKLLACPGAKDLLIKLGYL
jgi:hypothetical protein